MPEPSEPDSRHVKGPGHLEFYADVDFMTEDPTVRDRLKRTTAVPPPHKRLTRNKGWIDKEAERQNRHLVKGLGAKGQAGSGMNQVSVSEGKLSISETTSPSKNFFDDTAHGPLICMSPMTQDASRNKSIKTLSGEVCRMECILVCCSRQFDLLLLSAF